MMAIDKVPTEKLIQELRRRHAIPNACPKCNQHTMSFYQEHGCVGHWQCDGCKRRIEHCICGEQNR